MGQNSRNSKETIGDKNQDGGAWQNPGDFPEFSNEWQKTNIEKLQALLGRSGFDALRKEDERFQNFIKTTDKKDIHRYLSHINQKLREVSPSERGFHDAVWWLAN